MKIAIATLALGLAAYAPAGEGCTGGAPEPGQDSSCAVTDRGINSKSQAYVSLHCNRNGSEADSAELLPGPGSFPNCISGTYWPGCKNG